MIDLRAHIKQSAHDLQSVWTDLQAVNNSALPPECYEQWIKKAAYFKVLNGTDSLLDAREIAWLAVEALAVPPNGGNVQQNTVVFGTLTMDFAVARHLALTTYVAVTWSVFDRLTNVCGRLAGISSMAENPSRNPKVFEGFFGKEDMLGFSGQMHLRNAYSWPLRVSYKLRNWLVHEGYEVGETPLFAGDRIADGFRLHDSAVAYFE